MADSGSSYDLLNVSGPLTVETILRTLQQRFNDGHCYVSLTLASSDEHMNFMIRLFRTSTICLRRTVDLVGFRVTVCELIRGAECGHSLRPATVGSTCAFRSGRGGQPASLCSAGL